MSFASFKRKIEEGDTVILYIGISSIYAIEELSFAKRSTLNVSTLCMSEPLENLSPLGYCRMMDIENLKNEVKPTVTNKHGIEVEYTFQTRYGALRVMDLVGKTFGSKIQLTKGYAYALYPTPELWTQTLPHRTQILYTPDISLIITELGIREGSVVCEAGTGSGSLSHAILRSIGRRGHLYTCDFHEERVEVARKEFERHGLGPNVTVKKRDVCHEGWDKTGLADAVFLDLPKPWDALKHAVQSISPRGGRICSFSPCIEQVCRSVAVMRELGLTEINTVECLQREFQFRSIVLPAVECRKVAKPILPVKRSETNQKKVKLNPDDEPMDSSMLENEGAQNTELSETVKVPVAKDYTIRTAIPLLKMPGHTGFLTFATVRPKFKKLSKDKNSEELEQHVSAGDSSSIALDKCESETDLTKSISETNSENLNVRNEIQ